MKIAKTKMLQWMRDVVGLDRIRNEYVYEEVKEHTDIARKIKDNKSKRFGRVGKRNNDLIVVKIDEIRAEEILENIWAKKKWIKVIRERYIIIDEDIIEIGRVRGEIYEYLSSSTWDKGKSKEDILQ